MPEPLRAALVAAPTLADTARAVEGLCATGARIGTVNLQTGPAASLGKGVRLGAEAVFEAGSGKGRGQGRKISKVVGDDGCEPGRAIDETRRMIGQQKAFSPIVGEMGMPPLGAFTGAASLRQPQTQQLFDLRSGCDDVAGTG